MTNEQFTRLQADVQKRLLETAHQSGTAEGTALLLLHSFLTKAGAWPYAELFLSDTDTTQPYSHRARVRLWRIHTKKGNTYHTLVIEFQTVYGLQRHAIDWRLDVGRYLNRAIALIEKARAELV